MAAILPEISEEQSHLLEQIDPATNLETEAREELRILISLAPQHRGGIDTKAIDISLQLAHMFMRHYTEISPQASQTVIDIINNKDHALATTTLTKLLVRYDRPIYNLDIQQLTWLTHALSLDPDHLEMVENLWTRQKENRFEYLPSTRGHSYRNPRSWKGEDGPFDH